ncbi:MAG TPA: hypothetical protein VL443_19740 [Cyclobacteriaceae bacterium]|jgi:hypothetical protein|nr:hypothetical protein [Cyclobacteriaceae bacterium]
MHLFKLNILLYLSFHAIGFLFCLFSILGIPGNIDEGRSETKLLLKLINALIILGWYGIRFLALASIVAFYFEYDVIGKVCSILSLVIGAGALLSMIILYWVRGKS